MSQRQQILCVSIFFLLVAIMGLFSLHTLTSIYQDIGRHITLGEIIWKTKSIPTTNLFSFTNPDYPFINHHWLGEVLLYFGATSVGLQGLIVVKAILMMLAFGLALAAGWRRHLAVPAMVVGLISIFILVERTDVRPEVLSFVFLAWYLFVFYRRPHAWLIWTLPLVQMIWVNTHIYFFLGPVVFLAWWAGEIAWSWRGALQQWRPWLLGGCIALGTLVNPHGLSGALYPLHIFSNYGYSVMENKSPVFLARLGYPMMTSWAAGIGIFMIIVSTAINWRNLRRVVMGLILAIIAIILAYTMVRNFPILALVMIPVVLTNIDQGLSIKSVSPTTLMWGIGILLLIAVSIGTNQIYRQAGIGGRQFGLNVPSGPQKPIDFFRQAGIRGPLFNNFDVGSFLIWKLPEEPVFIDGRPEAYPADFIQNTYIRMQEDPAVWDQASARYGINTIFWNEYDITPWSRLFLARIFRDAQWVTVYRDQGIIILVRNIPRNGTIIQRYRLP